MNVSLMYAVRAAKFQKPPTQTWLLKDLIPIIIGCDPEFSTTQVHDVMQLHCQLTMERAAAALICHETLTTSLKIEGLQCLLQCGLDINATHTYLMCIQSDKKLLEHFLVQGAPTDRSIYSHCFATNNISLLRTLQTLDHNYEWIISEGDADRTDGPFFFAKFALACKAEDVFICAMEHTVKLPFHPSVVMVAFRCGCPKVVRYLYDREYPIVVAAEELRIETVHSSCKKFARDYLASWIRGEFVTDLKPAKT